MGSMSDQIRSKIDSKVLVNKLGEKKMGSMSDQK